MTERSFSTNRLSMRPYALSDFDNLRNLWADPDVTRFIGQPQTPEESWSRLLRYTGHWALMKYGYWVVEESASGSFVGEIGLSNFRRDMKPSLEDTPEAGWVVSPSKQGLGYATEALAGALSWAHKNLGPVDVACIIRPDHERSIRVATKCAFTCAGQATYKSSDVLVFKRSFGETYGESGAPRDDLRNNDAIRQGLRSKPS